jgi:predicted O-linked N-acetylglucosamine transferase (SPINDLY family)
MQDEQKIINFIEKHIENIFNEIWEPIDERQTLKLQNLEKQINTLKKQMTLLNKKIILIQIPIKQEFDESKIIKCLNEASVINKQTIDAQARIRSIEKNIKNEVFNIINNSHSEISIFINNLVKKAIDNQCRDFEYRCAQYIRAVESKITI